MVFTMYNFKIFAVLVVLSSLVVIGISLDCPPGRHKCHCEVVGQVVKALALDCDKRDLREVPDMSVYRGIPINFLNLANNRISTLTEDFLSGLTFLPVAPVQDPFIDLGGNAITGIPKHAFRGIRANKLGLRLNNCSTLDMIPREALRKMENLTFLMLHGNRIHSLPGNVFKGLKKLRHLDLSGNQIRRIGSDVFMGVEETLKVLYLNRLGLNEFPTAAIEKLTRLETLEIDDNKITMLGDNALKSFTTTAPLTLSLQRNGLETIAQRAIDGTSINLKKLSLSGNKLRTLHFLNDACHPVFDNKPIIDVRDNPVQCDCLLYGVVRSERIPISGTCSSPSKYAGKSIKYDFLSAARSDCDSKVAGTYDNCRTASRAPTLGASSAVGPGCMALWTVLGVVVLSLIDNWTRAL